MAERLQMRRFHLLALGATVLLYLLIVFGDIARRTGMRFGYGGWLLLPALVLILLASLAAWRSYRKVLWITAPLVLSIPILGVQALLIGVRLNPQTPLGVTAAYAATALMVHALALTSVVVAFRYPLQRARGLIFETRFARLTLLMVGLTFITLVSGVFVTVSGAARICLSWPFCEGLRPPVSLVEWIQLAHRWSVGVSSLLMVYILYRAWRSMRYRGGILVTATAGGILFFAQGGIGAALVLRGSQLDLIGLHAATAAAAWALLIVMAVQVGLAGLTPEGEQLSVVEQGEWRSRMRDFLALTKPIIVLLLLVTTFTGMVVGAQKIPSARLIFWTMVGGALAAGGSGAINQFIDIETDRKMRRTSRRPLAASRLTPGEGLAFGVALCLSAFYVLAVFTNLLAALLSVVGMFYYIWLYSIVLKRSTVQNIVIGGGAGAIPPLVGWAAATGSLTLPSLLLFLIIFFWTPPHFWSLALVRMKDYRRGGIPMLPVVHGERETTRQILIYTLELVGLTLLAPLFGIAGGIYLISALILGAALITQAWKLWRDYTPKMAWKMYRYSSMYLAFLFLVWVGDVVLT